jgi:hypothetical protein
VVLTKDLSVAIVACCVSEARLSVMSGSNLAWTTVMVVPPWLSAYSRASRHFSRLVIE